VPRKPKPFVGLGALLLFPRSEDRAVTLDLTRRFSSAVRFAYNRLLEGKNREELKRQDGSLWALFRLNTRYADDAVMKAREKGLDPRKVVFGGRRLFERLKRKHLSGKALERLRREWRERRQGLLYSRSTELSSPRNASNIYASPVRETAPGGASAASNTALFTVPCWRKFTPSLGGGAWRWWR